MSRVTEYWTRTVNRSNVSYLQLLSALPVDVLHELVHQRALGVGVLPELTRDSDLVLHFEKIPTFPSGGLPRV